jgi:hypothetical protein
MSKPSHRIERIRLGDITIDQRVQRVLDHTRVASIAATFDWAAFGVPTLSRRLDGVLVIVDGMHRIEAARANGHVDVSPQMKVHNGLSLEEEAALFLLLNNTRKPSPVDLFRIGVISGDKDLIEMNTLIESAGLEVANAGRKAFRAVTAMRRIYSAEPIAAARALDVCVSAWGVSSDSVQGSIFEGMGLFFLRYGDGANLDELAHRLSQYPGGALALLGAARGLGRIRSVSIPNAVGDITLSEYNKGRRTRMLPPWTSAG